MFQNFFPFQYFSAIVKKNNLKLFDLNSFATDGTRKNRFEKFSFSFGREGVPRYK